ncbi:unnamed protein product [Withania somnifera]
MYLDTIYQPLKYHDDGHMTEGQTNDFWRDILELKKSRILKRKATEQDKNGGRPDDEDLKRVKTNFEDLCDEDKIFMFYKKLLNEWNHEIDEMSPKESISMVATFRQCARDLNPLFNLGVTMVGIHERSAREKIHTNSVAHIMNDETTRKLLHSVRRLVTFCQRRYPTMPSKSVDFNSPANGSDLHSLHAQEATSQTSEGRLQIMPMPPQGTSIV